MLLNGRKTPKLPFPSESDPHLIHGSLVPAAHASQLSKRHLDRFSHFCSAYEHDQQRHTETVGRQTTLLRL